MVRHVSVGLESKYQAECVRTFFLKEDDVC